MKPERPKETQGVLKYSRVKFQTKQDYIPRMKGFNYAVTVAQLDDHSKLHLNAPMLFIKIH